MAGWLSRAQMRASSMNIETKRADRDSSRRIRLTTNVRANPSAPGITARNTSAIPPSPIRSSSR